MLYGPVAQKVEDLIYHLMQSSDLEYDISGAIPQEMNHTDASAYINRGPFTAVFTIMMQLFSSSSVVLPTLFIIYVIMQQSQLKNFRYWFIANLLLCDSLIAIVFLPAAIDAAVHMLNGQDFPMQFIVSFACIPSVSYSFMCCVILADMFCFLFIDKYQNILTQKKVIGMVMVAWIASCGVVVVLSIWNTSGPLSLSITTVIMLVIKIVVGISVLCLSIFLFYYWTKINIRLQEQILSLPTTQNSTQNSCSLRKQIEMFVRVKSSIKPLCAFFFVSLFGVAIEIIKAIILINYACDFSSAPGSFIIFIILTWLECMFCVIIYSILLVIIFWCSFFISNKIMPA